MTVCCREKPPGTPISTMTICMCCLMVPSQEEGESLIKSLLEAQLIVCGVILPQSKSFFFWQGQMHHADEFMVWLKAPESSASAISHYIKAHHSYDLPFIAFFSPLVSQELAQWFTFIK